MFITGDFIRHKKPYFGEPAYNIINYDSISDTVTILPGPSIHGIPAMECPELITSKNLEEYYRHVSLFEFIFLFVLGNIMHLINKFLFSFKRLK